MHLWFAIYDIHSEYRDLRDCSVIFLAENGEDAMQKLKDHALFIMQACIDVESTETDLEESLKIRRLTAFYDSYICINNKDVMSRILANNMYFTGGKDCVIG